MRRKAHLITALLALSVHAACSGPPAQGSGGSGGGDSPSGGAGGATTGEVGGAGEGGATTGGGGATTGEGGATTGPVMCSSAVETDEYAPELTKVGEGGFSVTLVESIPAPPAKGDQSWTVRVLDPGGQALGGLVIDVYPFMPDHGHGTAVKAAVTAAEEGTYVIEPINLFMSGVWVVRLKLLDAATSAELGSVKFSFCIGS